MPSYDIMKGQGDNPMSTGFRDLPSVNDVLSDDRVQRLVDEYTH